MTDDFYFWCPLDKSIGFRTFCACSVGWFNGYLVMNFLLCFLLVYYTMVAAPLRVSFFWSVPAPCIPLLLAIILCKGTYWWLLSLFSIDPGLLWILLWMVACRGLWGWLADLWLSEWAVSWVGTCCCFFISPEVSTIKKLLMLLLLIWPIRDIESFPIVWGF